LIEIKKSFEAGAEVVGGVLKPLFKPGIKKPIWWDEALMGPYAAVGNQYLKFRQNAIWGGNFAIRRDAVEKIGYFDGNLGLSKSGLKLLAEDSEFVARAVRSGLIVQFNPHAIVYHKLNAKRINLASFRIRAWQEGRTMKELKKYRSFTNVAFFKVVLFKAFRGPYFVLMRRSKIAALPIHVILLVYEVMGWLDIRLN
jgi:GT2 family glycosyltransferase